MEREYAKEVASQPILIERVAELESYRREMADVVEKIFARLKRVEDRVDSILGSEPREAMPEKSMYVNR